MSLLSECRRGVARTLPYLLSHHPPDAFERCYQVEFRGRSVRCCARCLGIYPAIVLGVLAFVAGPSAIRGLELVLTLPGFTLLEWIGTAEGPSQGSNRSRTAAGMLLGYAYGLGLCWLFLASELIVIGAAIGYGGVAGVLLARRGGHVL